MPVLPPPRKPSAPPDAPPRLDDDDDERTQLDADPRAQEEEEAYEEEEPPAPFDDEEDDERTLTAVAPRGQQDTFEDSNATLDPRRTIQALPHRPEDSVSQSGWRERNFAPRGTMPPAQVLAGIDRALKIAAMQRGPVDRTRHALKAEWLPLLRQAVEQAGGDGLDAMLAQLEAPPGVRPKDLLLHELYLVMDRLNRAKDLSALVTEGRRVSAAVKKALAQPAPKKLSLRYADVELEGRMEVDALLGIFFCSAAELADRLLHVTRTLETLREQLRSLPGASPDGLFRNFGKLKLEIRLIEAERRRRSPPVG